MNYAILNKIHSLTGDATPLIQKLKQTVQQSRFGDLSEMLFYRSQSSREDFYMVGFWFQLQPDQSEKSLSQDFFSEFLSSFQIMGQESFQLSWEYRQVNQSPLSSQLSLVNFPEAFGLDKLTQLVKRHRQYRRKIGGIIGVWMGYSLENPCRTLLRMDWASNQNRLDFVTEDGIQQMLKEGQRLGITIQEDSYELAELIEYQSEAEATKFK